MAPIICPQCRKRFRWSPALAGRTARCTCGTPIECPSEPPEDPTAYALAPDSSSDNVRHRPVPVAVASVAPAMTLPYRTPKDDALGKSDPETIKNLYMPLWLLGGGVVINVVAALFRERGNLSAALITVGIQMTFGTVLMTLGLLLAAKPRGIALGRLPIALLKIAAISVAPAALVALFSPVLDHIPLGGLVGWLGEFVFYFALLGVFFDLDQSDTWYCVFVIFVIHVAVYFLLMWGLGKWG
jgi:hypothetical protein